MADKIIMKGEFFIPEKPDNLLFGRLMIYDTGRMAVVLDKVLHNDYDIRGIDIINGQSHVDGELFSLVNCFYSHSSNNEYYYIVNELYKGSWIDTAFSSEYTKVTASITGLSLWLDERSHDTEYKDGHSIITVYPPKDFTFSIDESTDLILYFESLSHWTREELKIVSETYFAIQSKGLLSRKVLFQHMVTFRNFLSLFLREVPNIKTITFRKTVSEKHEYIELHLRVGKPQEIINPTDRLIRIGEMSASLRDMLPEWYSQASYFDEIVALLIASRETELAEASFLEAAKALELIHKYFLLKDDVSLRAQIQKIMSDNGIGQTGTGKKWTQRMVYTHLWEKVKNIPYFSKNFTNPYSFVEALNETRNYYTHYGKKSSNVWTPNKLAYKTMAIRLMAKALILVCLKCPPQIIDKIINAAGAMLYLQLDYESNPYSIYSIVGSDS